MRRLLRLLRRGAWLIVVASVGCLSVPPFSGTDDGGAIDGAPDAAVPGVVERSLRFTNPGPTVADVPLLVRLDSNCVDYALAGEEGANIAFFVGRDRQARELPFEVELWEPGGTSLVWVRAPRAQMNVEERIRFLYGSQAPTPLLPSTEVWSDYRAVWHLAGTANEERNSAMGDHTGTARGTTSVPGIAGPARGFTNGLISEIEFPTTDVLIGGWASLTFEIWLHPTYAAPADWPTDFRSGDEYAGREDGMALRDFRLFRNDGADAANKGLGLVANGEQRSDADLSNNTWNYIAVTFKGDNGNDTNVRFYTDGSLDLPQDLGADDALEASSGAFFLGSEGGFPGFIDEVRIANARFSADYIAFQNVSIRTLDFVTCP